MPGLGEELRAARESRSLSISDVSERIHIRSVYLQAIEEEDWASIAAPVYVRGFIRTYARFLELDPEDAVTRFNGAVGEAKPTVQPPPQPMLRERRPVAAWLWGLTAAAFALVFFVGYNYYQLQRATQAAIVAEGTAPASAGVATPGVLASPAAASPVVGVTVQRRAWVRVLVDGVERMEGTFAAGTRREFAGKKATIRTGNAGGIQVSIDGKELGTLGAPGEVVERTFELMKQ